MATTPRPVAVLAAGGKTTRAVLAALDRRGVPARAATRQDADLDTGAGLAEALAGCAAVWLAAPNLHPDEPGLVARVLAAARVTGVPRIVYHSVAWPYAPTMPHHLAKAVAEDAVRRSGLTFTILQPCAYAQNLLPQLATGRLAVPYSLDARFAFVDLDDVAAATAAVLVDGPAHAGATYELGGPELLSVREVAGLAGVVAEQLTPAGWAAGPGASLPPSVREGLHAMFASYDRYGFPAGHAALDLLLGRPATRVRDLIGGLAGR